MNIMHTLKPSSNILLNPAHPLAGSLIGCWLMNEGSGRKIYDSGPHGNAGALQGNTCFAPSRFGSGLLFHGASDYVTIGNVKGSRATIALWCKSVNDASVKGLYGYYGNAGGARLDLDIVGTSVHWSGVYSWSYRWDLYATIDPTQWCHICVQCGGGGAKLYVNGRLAATDPDEICFDGWTPTNHRIGWDFYAAAHRYFNGTIDHVVLFNRTLTAGEIAQLYREPFAMFKDSGPCRLAIAGGATYKSLSGAVAATSSLSARTVVRRRIGGSATASTSLLSELRARRRLPGVCHANAGLSGSLTLAGIVDLAGSTEAVTEAKASLSLEPEQHPEASDGTDRPWLRDVLSNGMTSNAFQFGTLLTRGWFWPHRAGCSAIYRGRRLAHVDFAHSVCVVGADALIAAIPAHVRHEPGLSYCYVVRRFNGGGSVERTTSAAVRLSLNGNGAQDSPAPNPISTLSARLLLDRRVALSWFHSPLGQATQTDVFRIFWDGGTGRADLNHPLAMVPCVGAGLHRYQSDSLNEGEYTFVVQPWSVSGRNNSVLSMVTIQVPCASCEGIQILGAL
jgi:hypothetical protein